VPLALPQLQLAGISLSLDDSPDLVVFALLQQLLLPLLMTQLAAKPAVAASRAQGVPGAPGP
jgi:hypothetical protein